MKKLYILRHAKSDYPEGVDDHERPLNTRGEKSCIFMGRYFRENTIRPDVILSSDAMRTTQTINNILRESGCNVQPQFTKKLYLATPGEILKELAKLDNSNSSAMVVCHSPGVQLLSAILTGSGDEDSIERLKRKYPTTGMACLTLATDSWQKIDPGCGHLDMFVVPKMLG